MALLDFWIFCFTTQMQRWVAFEQRAALLFRNGRKIRVKLIVLIQCGNDTNGPFISDLEEGKGGRRIEMGPPGVQCAGYGKTPLACQNADRQMAETNWRNRVLARKTPAGGILSETATFRQLVQISSDTLWSGTGVEESTKGRRAELIEEIRLLRQRLEVLEFGDRVPSLARADTAAHKREIEEKLRLLNNELHDLNVQLIREQLPQTSVEPG